MCVFSSAAAAAAAVLFLAAPFVRCALERTTTILAKPTLQAHHWNNKSERASEQRDGAAPSERTQTKGRKEGKKDGWKEGTMNG
jgi:hypothetical protein